MKKLKFIDSDEQIVYIGVIKHAVSKSGIIFDIGLLYTCYPAIIG